MSLETPNELVSFEFPTKILEPAGNITLRELIDSPLTQHWIVSAIHNAFNSLAYHNSSDLKDSDLVLNYRLREIALSIPPKERKALFNQCAELIGLNRERRERMNNNDSKD